MRASKLRRCSCTSALLLLASAMLGHIQAVAWIGHGVTGRDMSVNPATTIAPQLTSINAVATTSSINTASPTSLTTSGATPVSTETVTGGAYQVCHNLNGDFSPFCKPDNASSVNIGQKYYVTWDATYFSTKNTSIYLIANFVNSTNGGPVAFQSEVIESSTGFYVWSIDDAWRKGQETNNITLFINPLDPSTNTPKSLTGPTVMVQQEPKSYYQQPPTKLPEGKALYIGLPAFFAFIIICVCGGYWWNRKNREIGLGNIMSRKRGYGVRKSRRQRLGLGRKGKGVRFQEQELRTGDAQYSDLPVELHDIGRSYGRRDSDLGSLTGSIAEEEERYRVDHDFTSQGLRRY